jgi:hypothetical protein
MRTLLVSAAITREPNRYALVQTVAQGTRALHGPHTRIADTINEALRILALPQKHLPARNTPNGSIAGRNAA